MTPIDPVARLVELIRKRSPWSDDDTTFLLRELAADGIQAAAPAPPSERIDLERIDKAMDAMHMTRAERQPVWAVLSWSDEKPDAEHMTRYEVKARARAALTDDPEPLP